ncbi:hypothetical protein NN561_019609 [Cricetulus griseus]
MQMGVRVTADVRPGASLHIQISMSLQISVWAAHAPGFERANEPVSDGQAASPLASPYVRAARRLVPICKLACKDCSLI